MANTLYNKAREAFLNGSLSWSADPIHVMLVRSAYVFDAQHEHLSEVSDYDNGRSEALASKTVLDGVADAADISLSAVEAEECDALVLYVYDADDDAALLVAYIDTAVSGLPVTPAPAQLVTITWSSGVNRIFAL